MFAQCGLNPTKCLANLQCLVTFLWQRKLIKPTPAGGILFGGALVLENNATMGPIIFKKCPNLYDVVFELLYPTRFNKIFLHVVKISC